MTAATARPVTKAALSAFVREHTDLNPAQSKALTDSLLTEYSVTRKPPAGPEAQDIPVEAEQIWLHEPSQRPVRVTGVEMGPEYVAGDPVTSWGPQSVSWQDCADSSAAGTTAIQLWRELMRPLPDADAEADTEAEPTPEGDR